MKVLIAFLVFALVGCVYCKPSKKAFEHNNPGHTSSSSSATSSEEEGSNYNDVAVRSPMVQSPTVGSSSHHSLILENEDHIRSVEIFKAKVADRLNGSMILANQPDMKRRLMNIAMEKFKMCETTRHSNNVRSHVNHSCLGSATGQMMSLISTYEKNQRMQSLDSSN